MNFAFKISVLILSLLFFTVCSANDNTSRDQYINQTVKNKIALDKSFSKIQINTINGIVILTGEVNSESQAYKVIELAQSMLGVNDVDTNKLLIKNNKKLHSDPIITAKIKGLLTQQSLFSDSKPSSTVIHVETKEGIVLLSGKLDNQKQVDMLTELAKSIPGAKGVKSTILVTSE